MMCQRQCKWRKYGAECGMPGLRLGFRFVGLVPKAGIVFSIQTKVWQNKTELCHSRHPLVYVNENA